MMAASVGGRLFFFGNRTAEAQRSQCVGRVSRLEATVVRFPDLKQLIQRGRRIKINKSIYQTILIL
jgi:hypothetical protein